MTEVVVLPEESSAGGAREKLFGVADLGQEIIV